MSQEPVARKYESIVVFAPRLTDAQLREETKKVEGILSGQQCKEIKVDFWGRKETAYTIKKEKFGHYVVFNYETENHGAPNHLASLLRISDSVNKFQTHQLSAKKRKFQGNLKRAQSGYSDAEFYEDGFDSYES